jgi:tRNA (guanine26-N2/guanine27-N2)-dimethyltransferase
MIQEGKAKLDIKQEKIHRKADIFYNPVMKFNRDISLLIMDAVNNKDIQIALPLCASGIRGLRFLKELKKSKIKNITFNDYNKDAVKSLGKNLKLNGLEKDKKVIISNTEANLFLHQSDGFDYIDIDPFGSPNNFLDKATKRISRNGILAVTATDTSALTGTYENACKRKYWSDPLHNELMHEVGLRILIRKVQLVGAQYDKALTPIYSYSRDHYFRIFFRCEKGKTRVDIILKEHKFLIYNKKNLSCTVSTLKDLAKYEGQIAGPMWCGKLWDSRLAKKIAQNKLGLDLTKSELKFLDIIARESSLDTVGFLDLHKLSKITKKMVRKEDAMKKLKGVPTHFSGTGVRIARDI